MSSAQSVQNHALYRKIFETIRPKLAQELWQIEPEAKFDAHDACIGDCRRPVSRQLVLGKRPAVVAFRWWAATHMHNRSPYILKYKIRRYFITQQRAVLPCARLNLLDFSPTWAKSGKEGLHWGHAENMEIQIPYRPKWAQYLVLILKECSLEPQTFLAPSFGSFQLLICLQTQFYQQQMKNQPNQLKLFSAMCPDEVHSRILKAASFV